MNEEMVESVKEELVILGLTKDLRTYESYARFTVVLNGREFFSIYEKLKGGKVVYATHYKGSDVPALETRTPSYVFDQVKKWIEKETIEGRMG